MKAPDLETTLLAYFAHLNAHDYEAILNSLYPPLFDLVPKTQFRQAIEAQADEEVKIKHIRLLLADHEIRVGETRYRLLHYRFAMYLSSPKEDLAEALLQNQYGEKNVSYDETEAAFCVVVHARMYAIADPAFSGWKLLERKDQLMPLLEQLLPEEVLFGVD